MKLIIGVLIFATSILILFTKNIFSRNLPYNSNNYFSIAILLILLFFLFLNILLWFISLKRITHNISNIFSNNFVPISIDSNTELSELATNINIIAKKIETNKKRVKELDEIRNHFIANATHEFKTPLFSIKGYIETLQDGAINDAKVNEIFLKKMYNQAERLEVLFDNLINISKIDSKKLSIKPNKVLLNDIMNYLIENFTEPANKKGITLFIPNTKKLCIKGDFELLKTCFSNLVDNAIKYSNSGSVNVSVKKTINNIIIKVIDNGVGILEKHHSNIFERFYRVENSRSRDSGGYGLGLAIVKHVLRAHNSEIHVESTLNQGSVFSFELIEFIPKN